MSGEKEREDHVRMWGRTGAARGEPRQGDRAGWGMGQGSVSCDSEEQAWRRGSLYGETAMGLDVSSSALSRDGVLREEM